MVDTLLFFADEAARVNHIIKAGAEASLTDRQFLEREIGKWKQSGKRREQLLGERYYNGDHDILKRQREVIGQDGKLEVVHNLPNNRIVDNQYAKMVDQKTNYLLGKPFTLKTENKVYLQLLNDIFNNRFMRMFRTVGEDALNGAVGWVHPHYNEYGEFSFRRFYPYELLPFWKDAEHTQLDGAVRLYSVDYYDGPNERIMERVEAFTAQGIQRFVYTGGSLIPDELYPSAPYMSMVGENGREYELNWERIPLVAFKYNAKEIPLIRRVKSLQDGINVIVSDFENNMQEDARNTILVLVNYDGENLGEFRRNLSQYGAVKVKTVDGAAGDLRTLEVNVNADNYKAILEIFKKALIENAKGYDAKDDRIAGNPNQMNIQSMYSDIDLDANGMETEFQASFEELLWFVNMHLSNTGKGNFEGEKVEVVFNRDVLINESELIENCAKSEGLISKETIVSKHPWVTDAEKELARIDDEKQEAIDNYMAGFGGSGNTDDKDAEENAEQ